jgi:hypothetical protein
MLCGAPRHLSTLRRRLSHRAKAGAADQDSLCRSWSATIAEADSDTFFTFFDFFGRLTFARPPPALVSDAMDYD